MDKAPDAYRTISEVADDLDLPQHVLRFWETRFSQIRPLKRGGGRRYYRPEDIDLLKGIRHLLYGEGYTIRGVQRIIKENGIKAMQALGRGEGAVPRSKPGGPEVIDPVGQGGAGAHLVPDDDEFETDIEPETEAGLPPAGLGNLMPGLRRTQEPEAPPVVRREPTLAPPQAAAPVAHPRPMVAPEVAPVPPAPQRPVMFRDVPVDLGVADPGLDAEPSFAAPQAPAAPMVEAPRPQPTPPIQRAPAPPPPVAPQPEAWRPAPAPAAQPPVTRYADPLPSAVKSSAAALAADHVRRLQAALYELSECRKRLDQAFEAR